APLAVDQGVVVAADPPPAEPGGVAAGEHESSLPPGVGATSADPALLGSLELLAPAAAPVALVGAPAEDLAQLIETAAALEAAAVGGDDAGDGMAIAAADEAAPESERSADAESVVADASSADQPVKAARPAAPLAAAAGLIHQVAPGETLSGI